MVLNKRYKTILLEIIKKHLPTAKVYLFGSRAIDKEQPGSDIDIALDINCEIPSLTMSKIRNEIEESIVPMKIDLVDMYTAQDELKKDILNEGILWTN